MSRVLILALLLVVQLKPVYFALLSIRLPGGFYLSWFQFAHELLVLGAFVATLVGLIKLIRTKTPGFYRILRFAIWFNFFSTITHFLTLAAIRKDWAYADAAFIFSEFMMITFIVVTASHFMTHRGGSEGGTASNVNRVVSGAIDVFIIVVCSIDSYSMLAASGWIFGDYNTLRLWPIALVYLVVYYLTMKVVFRQTIGQLCVMN
jgi:hypothetical protein